MKKPKYNDAWALSKYDVYIIPQTTHIYMVHVASFIY